MSCKIVLDNFGGLCSSGSSISGTVVCTFSSKKQIRGVKIKLRGKEHTSWIERQSYYDSRLKKTRFRSVPHVGNNTFLAIDQILTGAGTMDPGRYKYPFTVFLPRNIPDTFKAIHGYITYYIKANVDIPMALDYDETMYFFVNSPIDFNDMHISELQLLPSVYQAEKKLWGFFHSSGPITLDVHLQKQAFIFGEAARIKIHVQNLSNESINHITLELKNVIKYSTSGSGIANTYSTEVLASASQRGVGAHGEETYELDFIIPTSLNVYNFNGCALFQQRIFLEVEAVIRGFHTNMKVEAGLVLGHIPLRSPPYQQTSYNFSAVQDVAAQPPPYYTLETTPYSIPNTSDAKAGPPRFDIVPSAPTIAEMSRYCANV